MVGFHDGAGEPEHADVGGGEVYPAGNFTIPVVAEDEHVTGGAVAEEVAGGQDEVGVDEYAGAVAGWGVDPYQRRQHSYDNAMSDSVSVLTYSGRLRRAQELCSRRGLAGLVLGPGEQLAYLTGLRFDTHERFSALVVPAVGEIRLVLPVVDRDVTPEEGLGIKVETWVDGSSPYDLVPTGRIGVGAELVASHVLRLMPGRELVSATEVLAELFVSKEKLELEELRRAGKAIDRVHAQVPQLLRPGRTEREVAADLSRLILEEHEKVDFVIVGSGPNGANPHHEFSDRILGLGDMVVVDIGGSLQSGYHSDCTRTYVVGGPGAVPRMYQVLYDAQAAAVRTVRPGVTAESVDAAAREVISAAGFGEFFIHRTGHGIGLSLHEEPFIVAGNTMELLPGMVFSVEPGIYIPGECGARIEDIVAVTEDGCELINNRPRELL